LDEERYERRIPLTWIGAEELPLLWVNRFVGQSLEDHLVLTIGQSVDPPLIGTPPERIAQLEQIAYVPIRPVARLALSRGRCEELIGILNVILEGYDRQQQEKKGGGEL
jgi:hypothetical protein